MVSCFEEGRLVGWFEDGETASLEYVCCLCGSPYRLNFLHSSRRSVGI